MTLYSEMVSGFFGRLEPATVYMYTVVFGLAAVNSQLAGKFTFFSGKCIYIYIYIYTH